ncbi:MAG: AmmeMemoRadiSam system protein A [Firmicutes bacterium]|mgnify:CR=1 FL=1|nr:AmmeMemoRadiSam system protein A [Bacillota bacterium]
MGVVSAAIVPHPAIIIPEVGGREISRVMATRKAMQTLSRRLKEAEPETIVIITPHGAVFRDAVPLLKEPKLRGSFAPFGVPQISYTGENDLELVEEITSTCNKLAIPTVEISGGLLGRLGLRSELDHGVLVPLHYFREEGINTPLVVIGMALLPNPVLYEFGQAVARAAARRGRRVAVVASGDLSHRLTPAAPAGYDSGGRVFDEKIVAAVKEWNPKEIMDLEPDLVERAGECGWRPIIMMSGSLKGLPVEGEVLSYQGPFGVGYLVASLKIGEGGQGTTLSTDVANPYVEVARRSLETYVRDGKQFILPQSLSPGLKRRAGAFVTLKKDGRLRGCIGTVEATKSTLAAEIAANALAAGLRDPRFPPVEKGELSQLTYSVDVMGPPEAVASQGELDPQRYGVIVRAGGRTGLLLPNLEGVETATQQVEIARQKAGIDLHEKMKLYRFEVERHY